jgi:hypothetical protein
MNIEQLTMKNLVAAAVNFLFFQVFWYFFPWSGVLKPTTTTSEMAHKEIGGKSDGQKFGMCFFLSSGDQTSLLSSKRRQTPCESPRSLLIRFPPKSCTVHPILWCLCIACILRCSVVATIAHHFNCEKASMKATIT